MHPSACEGIMWFKITGHSRAAMIGQLNIWNDENKMYTIYHRMSEFGSISQVVCSKVDIIAAHRHSVKNA